MVFPVWGQGWGERVAMARPLWPGWLAPSSLVSRSYQTSPRTISAGEDPTGSKGSKVPKINLKISHFS